MTVSTTNTTQTDQTVLRPPVVVVLGHVDHGKSSLLEAIREDFKITARESGGITQHIGAYQVEYQEKPITFIDTPGHAAFSAMRSRGARVADIALLVVAADDGVKEQTKEAIRAAKEAGIPIIAVINKIDKSEANVERTKQDLSQNDIHVESYGGKIPVVETSAETKQGISELLEMVLLVAEMEDLKTNTDVPAQGVVIESYTDAKVGPKATILVKTGKLQVGDFVGTHSTIGKIRLLTDFQENNIQLATPSMPVVVVGFEKCPLVGETVNVFGDESSARAQVSQEANPRERQSAEKDALFFDIVLKADTQGTLEAIENMLQSLPQETVQLRIAKAQVGDITESDVRLTQGVKARIYGFQVKTDASAAGLADREGIAIETFDVIYELVQRVQDLMGRTVEPQIVKTDLGELEVLAVFRTEKSNSQKGRTKQIVGGKVTEGEARTGSDIEVVREGESIGKGKATGLKIGPTETKTAPKGDECGVLYVGSEKIQEGDILKFSIEEELKI